MVGNLSGNCDRRPEQSTELDVLFINNMNYIARSSNLLQVVMLKDTLKLINHNYTKLKINTKNNFLMNSVASGLRNAFHDVAMFDDPGSIPCPGIIYPYYVHVLHILCRKTNV